MITIQFNAFDQFLHCNVSDKKCYKKKGMHKACLWTFDNMHQMEKTAKV